MVESDKFTPGGVMRPLGGSGESSLGGSELKGWWKVVCVVITEEDPKTEELRLYSPNQGLRSQ